MYKKKQATTTLIILSILSCYNTVLAVKNDDDSSSSLSPRTQRRLHWENQHKNSKAIYPSDPALSSQSIIKGLLQTYLS